MTDNISHVGYIHATGNALYGEISDIVKQREKDEGGYKKKKKSLRSKPLLQQRCFLPSLLFPVCFPCNGADSSHEITA